MLPSTASLLLVLPYLMLGFHLVSSYTTGACLQGFISDIPAESTLLSYDSLINNEDHKKTFLFPSTAFLCNGTLQELAVPYVVDTRDGLVWHTNLTAAISVWRPTELDTGHMEVVQFLLTVHLPGGNDESLYVAGDTHSDAIVLRPLNEVVVQVGDIIGITLSPKAKQDSIPLLLKRFAGSGSGGGVGCGDNATHNCIMISDRIPLVAVNLTVSQGAVPPSATLEGVKPTAAHSCACSHEVPEVTRMLTVYVSVCSNMNAAHHPSRPRQPPILSTATHDKPGNTQTGTTATITTETNQGATATPILASAIQTQITTPSLHRLQPTPMTPTGHATRDPQATGSGGTEGEYNGERGGHACEDTLITSSAVLGAAMGFLLIATIILSVFVALLTMKVKQLKRSRNMQGFIIKTDNEYIDIEQRDKYLDSKDADSKPVD